MVVPNVTPSDEDNTSHSDAPPPLLSLTLVVPPSEIGESTERSAIGAGTAGALHPRGSDPPFVHTSPPFGLSGYPPGPTAFGATAQPTPVQ